MTELQKSEPGGSDSMGGLGADADPHRGDPVAEMAGIDEAKVEEYQRRFGVIRAYFRKRPGEYGDLQQTLNQARIPLAYDEYLGTAARRTLVTAGLGIFLAVMITGLLLTQGLLHVAAPLILVGTLLGLSVGMAGILGAMVWYGHLFYPSAQVNTRAQSINIMLPHAIVHLYALTHGGLNLEQALRSLAEAEDTYGEMAREADMIVNDLDVFGNDLYTALQNARGITPSDSFEEFLHDLLSVVEAGGDIPSFLEDEASAHLEDAKDAQDTHLETISILSEMFVVLFIAGPLFAVVSLIVVGILMGTGIQQTGILIYGVFPVAMAGFLVVVDIVSEPFSERGEIDPENLDQEVEFDAIVPDEDDPEIEQYHRAHRWDRIEERIKSPFDTFHQEPLLTLALSAPVALAFVAMAIATGQADPTLTAMTTAPIDTTTWFVGLPLVIMMVPISVFHERSYRRQKAFARRFPDILNVLSNANRIGISFVDSLDLAIQSSSASGRVEEELERVRNDVLWNGNISRALLAFGARLRVPQVARTMRFLSEGVESTSDLGRVLSIASEDTRVRHKLEKQRRQELTAYIAVVVVGFIVYLGVTAMLDIFFLSAVSDVAAQSEGAQQSTAGQNLNIFPDGAVELYRMLFFHSLILQGIGSGLLIGKLAENNVLSGLKFAAVFLLVSIITFQFL